MSAGTPRWACPDARLVLRADAPRAQWLAARTTGIGGSDASTVAGVNPWSSLYELWLDKTGRYVEDLDNDAMEWGRRLEPVIRAWFAEETGMEVRRAGLMASRARPHQIVSVDGLAGDGGGLEIKTASWRTASEWDDDQVPDHAEVQAQHAMAVTGRSHWWIAGLLDGRTPLLRRVERDEALITDLTRMEDQFWAEHVVADVEPAVTAAALPVLKALHSRVGREHLDLPAADVDPLLAALAQAKAAVKAAQVDADTAEVQLRRLIGEAEAIHVDGAPRVTCRANGTFAASRFIHAHPEMAAAYQKPSTVLDVARLKTEHPDLWAAHRARVLRPVTTSTKKEA